MGPRRVSAYCRRGEKLTRGQVTGRQRGFTLLELLVVIAILAGLVAVAVPAFAQMFSRVRASFERSDLERQLLELPQRVRQRGRGGVLQDMSTVSTTAVATDKATPAGEFEGWDQLTINLPPGWTMRVATPIYYRYTGACSGGEIDLSLPPADFHYVLTAPLCRPLLSENHAR